MIFYSRNLLTVRKENLVEVARINVAYDEDIAHLKKSIEGLANDIMIDYPYKRTKPPKTELDLDKVLKFIKNIDKVKYFAISNAERPKLMKVIRGYLPKRITIVPKIETLRGVNYLTKIIKAAQTDLIMIDREDLYTNMGREKFRELYTKTCKRIHRTCKKNKVRVLELKGVIFEDII